MNEFLRFLLRILRLGAVWSILLMLLSGAAVIYTFLSHRQETVFGYIIYAVSAYALAAFVVGFPQTISEIKSFIRNNRSIGKLKTIVHENKYGNMLISDASFRVRVSLYTSLSVNLFYIGYRLFSAFFYSTFWFGAEAVFYIVITGMHYFLLRNMRARAVGIVGGNDTDLQREFRIYRFCGFLLFALNAALAGVVFQMIHQGMGRRYPGLLVYAAAVYAFFCLAIAIAHIIQYRKYKSPVLSAVKMIQLARALVAIFSLQTALFNSFGEDENLAYVMNSIFGGLLCVSIVGMAVYMVVRGFDGLKKIENGTVG